MAWLRRAKGFEILVKELAFVEIEFDAIAFVIIKILREHGEIGVIEVIVRFFSDDRDIVLGIIVDAIEVFAIVWVIDHEGGDKFIGSVVGEASL